MSDSYVDTTGSKLLPDGRWQHTFSQTFVGNFQKCPEQARAVYFREAKSEPTDSTSLGTACHSGWEYALHEKVAGNVASVAEMVDVVHHELDEIGEWKYTKMSRATVYDTVPRLMEGWRRDILPSIKPMWMEKKFRVLLYSGKHRDVYMNGTIDCVDEDCELWDWKTASRPYERWEKQRWAVQPTVYCYALDAILNDEALRTGYPGEILDPLTEERTFNYGITLYDGSTQILDVTRDATHLAWLRQQCSQIAWMIENNVNPWPLNDSGWWCGPKWCPKFAECKGAHITEGWAT